MILTALFLFLQTGAGQPVERPATIRPYLAGGVMIAKGAISFDAPFVQVQSIDGKSKWFIGASVRMVVPIKKAGVK